MEHPAGRKLQASDVELKGDSHSLDQKVQQPNEPSTNDGDVATIDRKQIAQKLIASTKQQSKMLAMNALLSAASAGTQPTKVGGKYRLSEKLAFAKAV